MKDFDVIHVRKTKKRRTCSFEIIDILELLTSIGRKYGFAFLFISIAFLLIGYLLGGTLIQITQQRKTSVIYLEKEYIYSFVYGALLYTALVTLVRVLNVNK